MYGPRTTRPQVIVEVITEHSARRSRRRGKRRSGEGETEGVESSLILCKRDRDEEVTYEEIGTLPGKDALSRPEHACYWVHRGINDLDMWFFPPGPSGGDDGLHLVLKLSCKWHVSGAKTFVERFAAGITSVGEPLRKEAVGLWLHGKLMQSIHDACRPYSLNELVVDRALDMDFFGKLFEDRMRPYGLSLTILEAPYIEVSKDLRDLEARLKASLDQKAVLDWFEQEMQEIERDESLSQVEKSLELGNLSRELDTRLCSTAEGEMWHDGPARQNILFWITSPVALALSVVRWCFTPFVIFGLWQSERLVEKVVRGHASYGLLGLAGGVLTWAIQMPFGLVYFLWPFYLFHGDLDLKWKSFLLCYAPMMLQLGKGTRHGIDQLLLRWTDTACSISQIDVRDLGTWDLFGVGRFGPAARGVTKQAGGRRLLAFLLLVLCMAVALAGCVHVSEHGWPFCSGTGGAHGRVSSQE